jgi:BTB/POZ domain
MELNCVFKDLYWQGNRSLYTCIITRASIIKKGTVITAIKGKHLSLKTNNEVQGIKFKHTAVVEFFPRELNNIFPRLKAIDITDCGLKELMREDFVGLENIEGLYIQSNQIAALPDDLFENMNKLTRVSFWNNKLGRITSQLLQPISENDLTFVSFGRNPDIRAFFSADLEGSVASLEELMNIIDDDCNNSVSILNGTVDVTRAEIAENALTDATFMEPTDFTIIANSSKKFRIHKNILSAQSSVFAGMLKRGITELKINDFDGAALTHLMNFVYSWEIPDNSDIQELLKIAVLFKVPMMVKMSENILLATLDESNAIEILTIGHRFKSDNLKVQAFNKIKEMFPESEEMMAIELMNNLGDVKKLLEVEMERKRKIEEVEKEAEENKKSLLQNFQSPKSKKSVEFQDLNDEV